MSVSLVANSDGSVAWSEQWGTPQNDYGGGVAASSTGDVFVAGNTQGNIAAPLEGSWDTYLIYRDF